MNGIPIDKKIYELNSQRNELEIEVMKKQRELEKAEHHLKETVKRLRDLQEKKSDGWWFEESP